jgi:recyclin-1
LSLPTIRTQSPELILDARYLQTSVHADASPLLAAQQPTFLASSSPAHLKSNVLSTFTNLLLIPVSIVPRTVETVSGAAVHGIAMLDPRRWGGAGQVNGSGFKEGYTKGTDSTGVVLWEDELEDSLEVTSEHGEDAAASTTTSASTKPPRLPSYDNLQLLLSLDVTLELIHTTRESLKRVEIFIGYPGTYGVRVRETIEELATELLGGLGERHIRNGFELCVGHSFRVNELA